LRLDKVATAHEQNPADRTFFFGLTATPLSLALNGYSVAFLTLKP
jgi:hypothetical protein